MRAFSRAYSRTRLVGGIACLAAGVSFVVWTSVAQAASSDRVQPTALRHADILMSPAAVHRVEAPPVDREAVAIEDEHRAQAGLAPRFAMPNVVSLSPDRDGTWEVAGEDTLVWRLRVASPGAQSLNLGFTRYRMPEGGQLLVYSADLTRIIRPFTVRDNAEHGQLWTPVVQADDIVVEVTIPASVREQLELELTSINVGYRGFRKDDASKSGSCNIDVVCPEGDGWRDEIPSVAVISTGGSLFCTGFMVNNTAQDQTPLFQTANHCGITSSNAPSLVAYWNYETSTCGGTPDGSLSDFQTGSYFRASYSSSDFTLVELDEPPDPAWGVTFAGWDRSGADASSAVGIHHPSTDEKRISFENDPTTTTSYLGTAVPGDGTHVRIIDWDLGTTEPGSSGSPLFDQNHRIIGQLHGGYAACGNDESDWYGRVSVSWNGGGTSSSRLRDWLDPGNTGAMYLDTLAPGASGLRVTPLSGLTSSGDPGGPFSPDSVVYTLENQNETPIGYSVAKTQAWVSLSDTGGTLPALGSTTVTVSINSNANSLPAGEYTDLVSFVNTTDGDGNTTREVTLTVGVPGIVYQWLLDTDPGWSTEGLWAFGKPTGGGGQYGGPDPTAGATGSFVYGYNLGGDYENSLPERHLTSTVIDCSLLTAVSLRFQRWLGVEQPAYDHAYLRVSNNGTDWTTVWQNGAEIADTAWSLQEFDISAVADNQSTVYLRWTMGPTDGSWQYCGWNIDDIQILGFGGGCTGPEDCDDGLWCNGAEDCVDSVCQPGTPPDCSDTVTCTDDSCNEGTDSCDNIANDANCDNGQYCDGTETCDAVLDCQPGTAVDCDDTVACTVDSCNEGTDSCDNIPDDGLCDNGLFCDGAETCDLFAGCVSPTMFVCDDSVNCTDDTCDEGTDTCYNTPDDANCDDTLFCNGAETCDSVADCQAGTDPCPGQDCDEVGDVCVPVACDNDGTCESGEDCTTCPADCISGGGGGGICGNGVCEPSQGEDCVSCADDCRGKQVGALKGQYCCGDGDGTNPVGCDDARCTTDPWMCSDVPSDPYCCGDGFCEGAEDSCNCEVDCGAPALEICDNGVDDDCDGLVDCLDTVDCAGDPACACGATGTPCTTNADCCTSCDKKAGTCR